MQISDAAVHATLAGCILDHPLQSLVRQPEDHFAAARVTDDHLDRCLCNRADMRRGTSVNLTEYLIDDLVNSARTAMRGYWSVMASSSR